MNLFEYIDKGLVHSLHTSERRAFRSCRRRHNWTYREMLYPIVTPRALEFGVAFHRAMETFYEPTMWKHDRETQKLVAIADFTDECRKQLKRYRRLVGEPEVDVLEDYKERVELGVNMLKFYCETVSPAYDFDFVPVEVEVPFEVPILSPQGEPIWCKCQRCWARWTKFLVARDGGTINVDFDTWQGLPVTYGGRLDMLAKDEYGRYWIFDWKTTSRILDEGSEQSFLELDDQISSYCWALKTYYNIPVAGFVYVEIKKAYPQPPALLSKPYKGKKFSTNKQAMTTSLLALQTFSQQDPEAFEAGLYDDYIAWLREDGPRFHQRHQIHKNDHEIEEIGKNLYLEAMDMVSNPSVYPQPGRFSCPSCLFRQPCLGMNQGEDWKYTLSTLFEKKAVHYYEEQPTTE